MTSPLSFFDLTDFAHRALFEGVEHAWEALDRLPDFFNQPRAWQILGEVRPGAVIVGNVSIGRGTVVEPGAYIIGPAIIGEKCEIRHGAYLRGNALIGDGGVVGHCSEVKSAILLPGAKAPHFNYVGDSILGCEVNLGAGTICANLRLDWQEVIVRFGGKTFPTGRQKLGAIIGDGAQTTCNTVLNPGTLIPKGALVQSGYRAISNQNSS